MRRVTGIVIGLVVALVLLGTRCGHPEAPAPPPDPPRTGRVTLDVEHIRRVREARRAKAQALVERYNPTARRRPGASTEYLFLVEPFCLLGSPDVCLVLVPLLEDCGDGQGDACFALAQFLSETPPRALVAPMLFGDACRAGVPEACERYQELLRPPSRPCEEDPFVCGWRAYLGTDRDKRERACAMGFGEVCLVLAATASDAEDRRIHLEHACQLDARGGCYYLGRLLAPDCETRSDPVTDEYGCLPTDAEGSTQALALACEAGLAEACEAS